LKRFELLFNGIELLFAINDIYFLLAALMVVETFM